MITERILESGPRARLRRLLRDERTEYFIIAIILLNAAVLGLETSSSIMERFGPLLMVLDALCLWIFTLELAARLYVERARFVRSPWNIFDFVVVAIAWMPSSGAFAVLRALRVLRVLRLITIVPSMRRVVGGLLQAIPGVGAIIALMGLVFYVFAVMTTMLYGATFPEWFGDLGRSAYTLFQIMTLESWSMGIVRPVMEKHPFAWAVFVPFILVTSFTVLNLFIGIIVNAMQAEQEEAMHAEHEQRQKEIAQVLAEVRSLRALVERNMASPCPDDTTGEAQGRENT